MGIRRNNVILEIANSGDCHGKNGKSKVDVRAEGVLYCVFSVLFLMWGSKS